MTDIYRGNTYWPLPSPSKRKKKKPRKQAKEIYGGLRNCCADLEELIGAGVFTEKEAKRLDKAVTVMKVGFKVMKKALGIRHPKQMQVDSPSIPAPQSSAIN